MPSHVVDASRGQLGELLSHQEVEALAAHHHRDAIGRQSRQIQREALQNPGRRRLVGLEHARLRVDAEERACREEEAEFADLILERPIEQSGNP
ncbi:hypothetical protein D3C84_1144220 [compost metagenome]